MSDETQCPFCGYANHKGHDCKAKERAASTIAELRKENERLKEDLKRLRAPCDQSYTSSIFKEKRP